MFSARNPIFLKKHPSSLAMKFDRKTIMTIFILFLFSGSILISLANILMQPKTAPVQIAVIETTMGTIEIELDAENAPITVANFIKYANSGFYDGLIIHRVISGPYIYIIQGGGFFPNGTLKYTDSPIALESNTGLSNVRGTIAMARTTDPNSATSQFFINTHNNNTILNYQNADNPGYAVFGTVVKGMEVVDAIEVVQTTIKDAYFPEFDVTMEAADWPVEDIIIESVTIKEA